MRKHGNVRLARETSVRVCVPTFVFVCSSVCVGVRACLIVCFGFRVCVSAYVFLHECVFVGVCSCFTECLFVYMCFFVRDFVCVRACVRTCVFICVGQYV